MMKYQGKDALPMKSFQAETSTPRAAPAERVDGTALPQWGTSKGGRAMLGLHLPCQEARYVEITDLILLCIH